MARIRTIKPEAHKHNQLWVAEQATGLPLFRAYTALWCQADREGRFRWRPIELKVECLPYWDGDFSTVLEALARYGFVVRYEANGQAYGWIPSFHEHQNIPKHEAKSRLPAPPGWVATAEQGPSKKDVKHGGGDGFHLHSLPFPFPSVPSESLSESPKADLKSDAGARASGPAASAKTETQELFESDQAVGEVDGDGTSCPLDLPARAEKHEIPEQFARAYKVPIDVVRYHVVEVLNYWTVGPGTGRRKRSWLQALRGRLHMLGKAGELVMPKQLKGGSGRDAGGRKPPPVGKTGLENADVEDG